MLAVVDTGLDDADLGDLTAYVDLGLGSVIPSNAGLFEPAPVGPKGSLAAAGDWVLQFLL